LSADNSAIMFCYRRPFMSYNDKSMMLGYDNDKCTKH